MCVDNLHFGKNAMSGMSGIWRMQFDKLFFFCFGTGDFVISENKFHPIKVFSYANWFVVKRSLGPW